MMEGRNEPKKEFNILIASERDIINGKYKDNETIQASKPLKNSKNSK